MRAECGEEERVAVKYGMTGWIRKQGKEKMCVHEAGGVTYLTFPVLEQIGIVKHAFSTRLGGASEGPFSTMNFSFSRGDKPEHVMENYRRMARVLGVDINRMVLSHQTHTTNVRMVTEEDVGKGIVADRDYTDIDGLITNIPGVTLVTFFADCVPLYFVDPVRRAIGMAHAGWRGTVHCMGQTMLKNMHREYGTDPADVVFCIGPSICQKCFEVGPEVVEEFREVFGEKDSKELFYKKPNDKYQLDLWRANEIIFLQAGGKRENIHTTDICTRCNHDLLFSHRAQGNERGNLAAFLCLN